MSGLEFVIADVPNSDDVWAEIATPQCYFGAVSLEPDGQYAFTLFRAHPGPELKMNLTEFNEVVAAACKRLDSMYPERVARRLL